MTQKEIVKFFRERLSNIDAEPVTIDLCHPPNAYRACGNTEEFQIIAGDEDSEQDWKKVFVERAASTAHGSTTVYCGFGSEPGQASYPSMEELAEIVAAGIKPRLAWATVVLNALRMAVPEVVPTTIHWKWDKASWLQRARWVEENPEPVAWWWQNADERLTSTRRRVVMMFEPLGTAAPEVFFPILRGLLQQLLEMRATRSIRGQVFVRPEWMNQTKHDISFTDFSKMKRQALGMTYPELHELLHDLVGEPFDELVGPAGRVTARTWLSENIWCTDVILIPCWVLRPKVFLGIIAEAARRTAAEMPGCKKPISIKILKSVVENRIEARRLEGRRAAATT